MGTEQRNIPQQRRALLLLNVARDTRGVARNLIWVGINVN